MPILFILLWSSGGIIIEFGLKDNGPLIFATLRLTLAWAVVFLFYLFNQPTLPKSWVKISKIVVTGILLQGLYQLFFCFALYHKVSPGLIAIILGIQPILTLIILNESITLPRIIGLTLGLVGLFFVVSNTVASGAVTLAGMSYSLLALLGITLGTVCQKKYCSDLPLISNLLIQYSSGALLAVTFYLFMPEKIIWSLPFVLSLSWMVLVISIGATMIFFMLLKRNKASNVTSLLYCVPLVTAIADYLIFGHSLSLLSIGGMVLIIMSLFLMHSNLLSQSKVERQSSRS